QYVGGQTKVVLCASHDTGSAVEGIPMEKDQLFLSSGTWSLLGACLDNPITTLQSQQQNYANEGGVGYIRYLKNIMGMWVVNNLKKELCPDLDFATLIQQARENTFNGIVDVNDQKFMAPQSMVQAFDSCFESGNKPQTIGDYFKCAFVSLMSSRKKVEFYNVRSF
ncbi:MAG: rhamnulokinase, partial [Clostridia bacterium]|nr:rhamnulokinase [Clostridia bacterium]